MRGLASTCLCLVLFLGVQRSLIRAEEEPGAKKSDLRKLMELTGAGELGRQMQEQLLPAIKASEPKVPERFWTELMAELNPNELVEMLVPIYDKHFTQEEIRDLIRFYESPSGRKMIRVMPEILRESMQMGQTWGMGLSRRIAAKLERESTGSKPE
jgi:hypothetical protein